jgi:hypothetical protein
MVVVTLQDAEYWKLTVSLRLFGHMDSSQSLEERVFVKWPFCWKIWGTELEGFIVFTWCRWGCPHIYQRWLREGATVSINSASYIQDLHVSDMMTGFHMLLIHLKILLTTFWTAKVTAVVTHFLSRVTIRRKWWSSYIMQYSPADSMMALLIITYLLKWSIIHPPFNLVITHQSPSRIILFPVRFNQLGQ